MRDYRKVEKLQKQCDAWNERYPIGTAVVLKKDIETIETKTRSEAEVLSGHSAVIWLDGVRGCWELDRVMAKEQ